MHTNIVFRQKLWITWSALILSVLLFLLLCQMQLKASNLHRGIFLSCKLPSSSGARRKATSPQLLCSRIKHWTFRLPTCTLARQLSMTIAKEGQNVLLEVFFLTPSPLLPVFSVDPLPKSHQREKPFIGFPAYHDSLLFLSPNNWLILGKLVILCVLSVELFKSGCMSWWLSLSISLKNLKSMAEALCFFIICKHLVTKSCWFSYDLRLLIVR